MNGVCPRLLEYFQLCNKYTQQIHRFSANLICSWQRWSIRDMNNLSCNWGLTQWELGDFHTKIRRLEVIQQANYRFAVAQPQTVINTKEFGKQQPSDEYPQTVRYSSHFHYNNVTISAMASLIIGVPIGCLNCWFSRRSKRTSKLRVICLCTGNSPMTGELPTKKASNADSVFIWWRHHNRHNLERILIKHG